MEKRVIGLLLVSACRSKDDLLMDEGRKPRFSRAMWITVIIVVLAFWGVTRPYLLRSQRTPNLAEALSNGRQIGFALYEFDKEYGSFPDETTAAKIPRKDGTQWELGNSSANDFFRQLIAAGIVTDESIFHAKTAFSRNPDNRIKPSQKALVPGEVGFGYFMNGKSAYNTRGNPSRPLVCAPLSFDGNTVSDQSFDPSIYDGKACVVRIDGSVTSLNIDPKTNRLQLGGGKHLLETGPDTVWGDSVTPVLVPPLPKP